jgi:uncharacterized membrane protein YuzA (DUF378 family)
VKHLSLITGILLVVGGLNWLLVGLFKFDLVAEIVGKSFGETNAISRIIYILVGLAAIAHLPALLAALRNDRDLSTTSTSRGTARTAR